MSSLKRSIAQATARVDAEAIGLSPGVIAILFEQLAPKLIGCLRRWIENPTPEQMQGVVKEQYEQNPKRIMRKTARRIRAEADVPMTKNQSFVLAKAAIEQIIEGESQEVAEAASEALVLDVE